MTIPKIIFQTSKKINSHNLLSDFYLENFREYKYFHYSDGDAINAFKNLSFNDLNFSAGVLNEFLWPAHKADYIRYFFLYLYGGIYIDTDIELIQGLPEIINEHDSVFVFTNRNMAFNGFIACYPQHPVIYDALRDIYENPAQNDYFYFCKKLAYFIRKYMPKKNKEKILLLKESFIDGGITKITSLPSLEDVKMYHHYQNKDIFTVL